MRVVVYLVILLTTNTVFGQNREDQNRKLRGTWLKVEGKKDTLKFYMDNKGVDFSIIGIVPENRHGYYATFWGDSINVEGMCVGHQGNKYYKLDSEENTLIIQDFYNNTNDRLIFRKISDKVW